MVYWTQNCYNVLNSVWDENAWILLVFDLAARGDYMYRLKTEAQTRTTKVHVWFVFNQLNINLNIPGKRELELRK